VAQRGQKEGVNGMARQCRGRTRARHATAGEPVATQVNVGLAVTARDERREPR
jgi:hypothetical protein